MRRAPSLHIAAEVTHVTHMLTIPLPRKWELRNLRSSRACCCILLTPKGRVHCACGRPSLSLSGRSVDR